MKKIALTLLVILLAASSTVGVVLKLASADTFNQNNIMDDAVFDDASSMTQPQIQSFLNAFPNSCLSNYSAPYPSDYFTYGANAPASAIIKQVSNLWGINPKVILTTLEKEESLVTGNAGCDSWRYNSAVGMGCSDSGPCPSPGYAGFSQQVTKGMWQLMFNRERSEGNLAWGDNGSIYYGGYMTPGTYSRQSGSPATYYDGIATIDGTSVTMTNGATAALYTYTPHFHGNQNFQTIFNQWFGSTHFPQPIGGLLYQQQSNGAIYLIDDSTSTPTKYLIPDWDVMVNYGLNSFPALSVTDSTLASMNDGGALTNLVFDNNGVYLVNNTYRLPVPAQECTDWGFSCSDGTVVKSLNDTFQNQYLKQGGVLTNYLSYGGVGYKMVNGQRLPLANLKTVSDLGMANTQPIFVTASNARQPIGPLLMTTPNIVKFTPNQTLYYYDGSHYFTIPDLTVYNSWNLSSVNATPVPYSSYNAGTSVPSTGTLSYWVQDGQGNKYIVNNGEKTQLSTQQQALWSGASYLTGVDSLLNTLPSSSLGNFIKSGPDYYQLNLSSGDKHYIVSMSDYANLGGNDSNTTYLNSTLGSSISSGLFAFPDGALLKVGTDPAIYVMNQGSLHHIPSMDILYAYNFDTTRIIVYPPATGYPVGADIVYTRLSDGTTLIPNTNSILTLSGDQASAYGLKNTISTTSTSNQFISRSQKIAFSNLIRNTDDGSIYYANNGALHHIQSMDTYRQLGGGTTPLTSVNTQTINLFTLGANV